jgi:hypothetical protein
VNTKVTTNIFSVVGILFGLLNVLYISGTCTMHGPTVINYYVVCRITVHAYGEFNCHWTRCNTEESSITLSLSPNIIYIYIYIYENSFLHSLVATPICVSHDI